MEGTKQNPSRALSLSLSPAGSSKRRSSDRDLGHVGKVPSHLTEFLYKKEKGFETLDEEAITVAPLLCDLDCPLSSTIVFWISYYFSLFLVLSRNQPLTWHHNNKRERDPPPRVLLCIYCTKLLLRWWVVGWQKPHFLAHPVCGILVVPGATVSLDRDPDLGDLSVQPGRICYMHPVDNIMVDVVLPGRTPYSVCTFVHQRAVLGWACFVPQLGLLQVPVCGVSSSARPPKMPTFLMPFPASVGVGITAAQHCSSSSSSSTWATVYYCRVWYLVSTSTRCLPLSFYNVTDAADLAKDFGPGFEGEVLLSKSSSSSSSSSSS